MDLLNNIFNKDDLNELIKNFSEVYGVSEKEIENIVITSISIIAANVYEKAKSKEYLQSLLDAILSSDDIRYTEFDLLNLDKIKGSQLLDTIFLNDKKMVISDISKNSNVSEPKITVLLESIALIVASEAKDILVKDQSINAEEIVNKIYKMRNNPLLSMVMKTYIKNNLGPDKLRLKFNEILN